MAWIFSSFEAFLADPPGGDRLLQLQAEKLLVGIEQRAQLADFLADEGLGEHGLDVLDGVHAALAVVPPGLLPEARELLIVLGPDRVDLDVLLEPEGAVAGGLEQVGILLRRYRDGSMMLST